MGTQCKKSNRKRNANMGWIKDNFRFFISKKTDKLYMDFEEYNNLLVLNKIKLISIATVCATLFFLYFDLIIVKNGVDKTFKMTLISMHLVCVAASIIYLVFYERIIRENPGKFNLIEIIPRVYTFLYISVGAFSSINSQRFTGNINSYVILILVAAVAFTVKPLYMLFALGTNHIIFLIGISILNDDKYVLAAKQMNSTAMVVIALLLSFSFYKFKMNDFVNKKRMQESEENFKRLFHINPFPVFITRLKDGKVMRASKKACSFIGLNQEDLDAFNINDIYVRKENRVALIEELEKKNSVHNLIVEYSIREENKWVSANYELIDYQGEKCILTGIMDITEIRKVEEELSKYASTDMLTGILNRRMGIKIIQELINESKSTYREFVLCFLDINGLKNVNDTYGHGEGDNYIKTFCGLIRKEIRQDDMFFRMGGDEFIIIFMNKAISEVETLWKKLLQSFGRINETNSRPYSITASHGLFYFQSGMEFDLEQIIENADKQMYKEKLLHKENGTATS